jgi:hypothetical protein
MNRFLQIQEELARTKKSFTKKYSSGKKVAGKPLVKSKSATKFVRPFSKKIVDYHVDILSKTQQPSKNTCWAAALTMLYSWKHKVSIDIKDVLKVYGKKFVDIYEEDLKTNKRGISKAEEKELYKIAGLSTINQLNPTIKYWEELLKAYGPLSITVDSDSGLGISYHAWVFTGISGDGTADGTEVKYIETGTGTEETLKFSEFLEYYEQAAGWPIQIIHW